MLVERVPDSMVDANSHGLERPITGEQLFRLGDIGPCELIDGRIVPMSPTGGAHGAIEAAVAFELRSAVRANGIAGEVLTGEVGIYTRRNPDRVRGADVVFQSDRTAALQTRPDGFLDVAPELIVEIMSPDDGYHALEAKAAEYLQAGVRVVLVLDPSSQSAHIYRPGAPTRTLASSEIFEVDDILPGVRIQVSSFFEP